MNWTKLTIGSYPSWNINLEILKKMLDKQRGGTIMSIVNRIKSVLGTGPLTTQQPGKYRQGANAE